MHYLFKGYLECKLWLLIWIYVTVIKTILICFEAVKVVFAVIAKNLK